MTLATTETSTVATAHQPSAPMLSSATMEQVVVHNDLSKLTPAQRLEYYMRTCEALGLNPLTRPLAYLNLKDPDGGYKLTLYATRDATEQLRRRDSINIQIVNREMIGDTYIVTARATTPGGRFDESTGVVSLVGKYGKFTGDMLSNAMMKAETKSKRRVTLSIAGLGFIDESEVDSIPGARRVQVDEAGEVIDIPVAPTPQAVAGSAPEPAKPQAAPAPKPSAPAPQRPPQAAPAQATPTNGNGHADLIVNFGKHKGKALSQVYAEDASYVAWLAANATTPALKAAAQALTASAQQAPQAAPAQQGPSQQQIARLMAIAHEGNVPKEVIQARLIRLYGIDSLKVLTREQYDEVCEWLENGGLDDEDIPPEAYDDEHQETFGDVTGPMQW